MPFKKVIKKIKHITSKEYKHRQYVILSTLLAVFLLALAVNRFILNRSTILINLQYQEVEILIDGQEVSLAQIDEDTFKFVTIPGKHTISIMSGQEVNHKEVIEAPRGRTVEITPTVTIASNPESDVVGQATYLSYDRATNTLYYLGRDLTTLVRYNLDTGEKVAISDPIFKRNSDLEWITSHKAVITKDSKNIWYIFDFTKPDFVNSEFKLLADPNVLDIKYDATHNRLGFVEFRDNEPVFGTADTGMNNKNILAVLDKLSAPEFVWSKAGTKIAVIDNPLYSKGNLFIYDLAIDQLYSANAKSVSKASFSPNGAYLVAEENDTALPVLVLINPDTGESDELFTLAKSGAFVWHDDSNFLTVQAIDDNGNSQLIKFNVSSKEVQLYESSPTITNNIEHIYLTNDESTLHFVSNNTLYSFPLKLAP